MAHKTEPVQTGLQITTRDEENLIRVGLSGEATIKNVQQIRMARAQFETSHLPILIVDDGLTYTDTVAFGALVQWAQAVRNRNIGWMIASTNEIAGRMLQMGGLNPKELLHPTEDAARKALDRGKPGQRVAVPSRAALALEGLRPK